MFYVKLYVHSLVDELKWLCENARCYSKIYNILKRCAEFLLAGKRAQWSGLSTRFTFLWQASSQFTIFRYITKIRTLHHLIRSPYHIHEQQATPSSWYGSTYQYFARPEIYTVWHQFINNVCKAMCHILAHCQNARYIFINSASIFHILFWTYSSSL